MDLTWTGGKATGAQLTCSLPGHPELRPPKGQQIAAVTDTHFEKVAPKVHVYRVSFK